MNKRRAATILISICATYLFAQNVDSGVPPRDDVPLKDLLVGRVSAFMHAWQRQDATTLTAAMAPESCTFHLMASPREKASWRLSPTHVHSRATA